MATRRWQLASAAQHADLDSQREQLLSAVPGNGKDVTCSVMEPPEVSAVWSICCCRRQGPQAESVDGVLLEVVQQSMTAAVVDSSIRGKSTD